ncbi:MAG TPA: hypothetical protein DCW41_08015 [Clostridiales bacterium]|jgi:ribosomal protein S18 acetylase RimI-like enzyme|nr:hypothetical protein [Clostridiales bacterium]
MIDLKLRRATRSDAPAVSDLIHEAMESYRRDSGISKGMLESLSESVESVTDRIEKNNCLCLYIDDRPVGTITLSPVDNPMKYNFSDKTEKVLSKAERVSYISRFAVADLLRKTGLGVQLMDAAVTLAEYDGSDLILLHTAVTNKNMCEFYKNRGFELIDSERSRGYERGLFAKRLTLR